MFGRLKDFLDSWYVRLMPDSFLRLKPQYQWSIAIFVFFVLWIGSGFITGTRHEEDDAAAAVTKSDVPLVKVAVLDATSRNATITVRGSTQALHSVDVRAEVEGVVQALHFEKGDAVKKDAVLCEIKTNDRGAKLEQAKALVDQTAKQHEVNLKLAADGFRSKTQVAQSAAALEAARAQLRTMQIQFGNTRMRAPFAGKVNDRYVDVGDYMRVGDKCAQLIAPEPFLAVGMVTEREVGQVQQGDQASADLVTGQHVEGTVRFVATKADDVTRAFRVEVELPNPNGDLRDGISADIHIPVRKLKAQKISPAILVLDDNGVVGVRVVDDKSIVHFRPVQIVSDGPDGMWVSGLPQKVTVITIGQQFVSEGEKVKTVADGGKVAS